MDAIRKLLIDFGNMLGMLSGTVSECVEHIGKGRMPIRIPMIFQQTDRAGVGSVPLVMMVSFFLGLTMALLTGYQLKPYGTEQLVPGLIAIAFSRELGPLLTGIVLAARVGAAYTAELGTMLVSEEVEAIDCMGLGPLRFLVAPRLLAVTLMLPLLNVLANIAALAGGWLVSTSLLSISTEYFNDLVISSLMLKDVLAGTIKCFFFGLIIGVVGCYKGLTVKGGSSGVGDATTSSVVTSITTVIGCDTLINLFLTA